jgi:predicted permease
LTLALVGTTTLVNLLDALVFRALPVRAPDQLVGLVPVTSKVAAGFTPATFQALAKRQQALSDLCGITTGYGTLAVQADAGAIRPRTYEAVTAQCYALLGIAPSIGRLITSSDVPVTGDPGRVVVISDRMWREEFGSARDVVGQTLFVESTPLSIIGVFPRTYRGLNVDLVPDIALPISLTWKLDLLPPLVMQALGRARPELGFRGSSAHLRAIWPEVFKESLVSGISTPVPELRVTTLANGISSLRERYQEPLYALAVLAGCLLVLACINVGGLLLTRIIDRRHSFAVQVALGASPFRLMLQVVLESLVVGAVAVLLAVPLASLVAQVAGQFLWTGFSVATMEFTPGSGTLLVSALIGFGAALLVSVPGIFAVATQQWELRGHDVGHGAARNRSRWLVSAQLALSLVLVFCAALFSANLYAVRALPLGYETHRLLWAQLDKTSRAAAASSMTIGYVDALVRQIAGLPDVESAAMSQVGFGRAQRQSNVVPVKTDGAATVNALFDRVSPEFFHTTSISLLRGREFSWEDVRERPDVAIVNHSLTARLFGSTDSIGKMIKVGGREQVVTIVGVVGDATPGDPRIQSVPQYYLPLGSSAPPAPTLLVKLRSDRTRQPALSDVVARFGRHQVLGVRMMGEQVESLLVQERLISTVSLLFAVLAGIVTIAGIFAMITQSISRRTREIGIRVALGATPGMVRLLILRQVTGIVVVAIFAGTIGSLSANRLARSLVSMDSSSTMPLLVLTAFAIAVVAFVTAAWPTTRAVRIDVATSLRAE